MSIRTVISRARQYFADRKNRYIIGLSFRVMIVAVLSACIMYLSLKPGYIITILLFIFFLVLTLISIIHHVKEPQRKISSFIEMLLTGNDLPVFIEQNDEISSIFNRIAETIHRIKIEKQTEYELFTEVINRLSSAVLVTDSSQTVILSNKAALQLLRVPSISSLRHIRNKELSELLSRITPGERILIKSTIDGIPARLAISASEVRFSEGSRMIITLNDIQEEVAREETEAWKKVIRILAHEIINSTGPINMLASSMYSLIDKGQPLNEDDRKNLLIGLEAIAKRSQGINFLVDNYRTKATIPAPSITAVSVEALFGHVMLLFENNRPSSIHMETFYEPDIWVMADERLLEQVLINLIRNSIEAANKPETDIRIKAEKAGQYVHIKIADNGCGISDLNMDNIFTPFFTTKEKGSGIGLFISRNIIWAMHGSLTVQSIENKTTTFIIRLPIQIM